MQLFFIYIIVINVVSFIMFGADKLKAKKGHWRISEKSLLTSAVLGGSVGAMAGMKVFHHKTKHRKFVFGIPAIFVFQVLLFAFMFLF